jgi:AmiR/NasT family two-component response regulator
MSEISADGYAVALRPVATRLFALHQRAEKLEADVDSRIIEQAKGAISARLGTTPDIAFEMLCGFARSQGRELHEYAAAVVAKGGLLDA